MSFRIKPSHAFLKPSSTQPTESKKKELDDILGLKSSSDTKPVPGSAVQESKIDAKQGLVIKQNYRAVEDYY